MVVAMTAISEIDLFAALSAEGDLVSFAPLCCLWCQIASPMFRHFNSDCDRGSPLLTCSTFGTHLVRRLRFRIFVALGATATNAMLNDENPASATFALWNHLSRRAILLS